MEAYFDRCAHIESTPVRLALLFKQADLAGKPDLQSVHRASPFLLFPLLLSSTHRGDGQVR